MKKIYIISGERSGDMHAGNLVLALKQCDSEMQIQGMGGSYSQAAGVQLTLDYAEVSVMGFLEVLLGFRKVLRALKIIKNDLLVFRPDLLILVDFGGFNMKVAAFAKKNRIPVHYYIPPKIWAWNQKRAFTLKKVTDEVYSILPFEPSFFEKFGMRVHYVGNPLWDEITAYLPQKLFLQQHGLSQAPILALLPGSRKQEVQAMLDTMLSIVKEFPQVQVVVAGVANLSPEVYQDAVDQGIKVIYSQTYDLLAHAFAAVVTSGTATLETALFRVPQVVVYRTSFISYQIGKRLIRVPFISLPNLIAGKQVVKELIQNEFSAHHLQKEIIRLVEDLPYREEILKGYDQVIEKLGRQSASATTARLLLGKK